MIGKFFRLKENNTSIIKEFFGGTATFMTMSYIIFVQPAVLSVCGIDKGAVFTATCISSAIATFLMGIYANYPISLAPGMGQNFYFALVAVPAIAAKLPSGSGSDAWAIALGAVFISGVLFIILSFAGFREMIINAIPSTLKNAIAVGIGLLIALIGFEWGGIIEPNPGTFISLTSFKTASPPIYLCICGLAIISTLIALNVKGAILIGLISSTIIGISTGLIPYNGLINTSIPSLTPTFLKMGVVSALKLGIPSIIFVFFFLDLFDTIGTLIGVSEQAGFIDENGKLPRARKALFSDATGTVIGAALGTSTITSYIESAAGVATGARTGLANIFTGLFFLAALYFSPLIEMIGIGIRQQNGVTIYPVIAPALITVGFMMTKNITKIQWNKPAEAISSYLTMLIMPFGFGITEGISFGFISYSFLKTVSGQWREVHPVMFIFAILFIIRYFIS